MIEQDWPAYTRDQHATWAELVGRRMPQIERHACEEYLEGFSQIGLTTELIPNLADVNRRLTPPSGWPGAILRAFCEGWDTTNLNRQLPIEPLTCRKLRPPNA